MLKLKCLDICDVSLKIGTSRILNNVSFTIEPGTIHALIGDNGVGKTSLLRIILGLTPCYTGTITAQNSINVELYRRHIGSVLDSIVPDTKSTCSKYLYNICLMLGTNDADFEEELLKKVGLQNESNKRIGKFSLGMKRRLMIACALASRPQFLVLDEPFNGIDPKGMNEMRLLLQRLKSEGVTILITSHIITELLKIADVYSIMYAGSIVDTIFSPDLSQIKMNKVVIRPKDTAAFVESMKTLHPELLCIASSEETVSIYNMTNNEYLKICNNEYNYSFEEQFMSEEDILLWKMSGFQI